MVIRGIQDIRKIILRMIKSAMLFRNCIKGLSKLKKRFIVIPF